MAQTQIPGQTISIVCSLVMILPCCFRESQQESERLCLQDTSRDSTQQNGQERENNPNELDDSSEGESHRRAWLGYITMVLAVGCGVTSMACTQGLDKSVPHSELNGFRFTFLFFVTLMGIGSKKCDVTLEKNVIGWMILYSIILTVHNYCHFGMLYYLPIGVASGTSTSITLVITYITNCIIGKIVTWYELFAGLLCITGILLVTQPTLAFKNNHTTLRNSTQVMPNVTYPLCHVYTQNSSNFDMGKVEYMSDEQRQVITGYAMCVSAAILISLNMYICYNKLIGTSVWKSLFWASLFGLVASWTVMGISESPVFPKLPQCMGLLCVHILMAAFVSIFSYSGAVNLDPFICSLIFAMKIAGTGILQYTFLSGIAPGHANAAEISGLIVILIGNSVVPLVNTIKKMCHK